MARGTAVSGSPGAGRKEKSGRFFTTRRRRPFIGGTWSSATTVTFARLVQNVQNRTANVAALFFHEARAQARSLRSFR